VNDVRVWVVGDVDRTIYEVNPDTASVVGRLELGPELRNPAAGAGSFWVAAFGSGEVLRIAINRSRL